MCGILHLIPRRLIPVMFVFLGGCGGQDILPEIGQASEFSELKMSKTEEKERIQLIRDGLAEKGIKNSLLVSAVAFAESGFAHCWAEAQWACRGPVSPSCGNDAVIAGASDGACSLKQGGLGMFQFDSGTYTETIRKYGASVLTVEGNAAAVIPFLVRKIKQAPVTAKQYGVQDIESEEDLVAWMNSIKITKSDAKYNNWLKLVSCLYNGSCGGEKANTYHNATVDLADTYGLDIFETKN